MLNKADTLKIFKVSAFLINFFVCPKIAFNAQYWYNTKVANRMRAVQDAKRKVFCGKREQRGEKKRTDLLSEKE